MKKTLATILVLSMLLACFSAVALAAGSVYFSGNCNVRTGPGLGYASIGTIGAGHSLTWMGGSSVDYRGVTWYSVSFKGMTGWVSSKYASLGGGYSSGGGYSGSGYSSGATTVYGSTGSSKVRTGPGLGYSTIGTLAHGSSAAFAGSIQYDSRGVAWYQIYWGSKLAWVSSRYTSLY